MRISGLRSTPYHAQTVEILSDPAVEPNMRVRSLVESHPLPGSRCTIEPVVWDSWRERRSHQSRVLAPLFASWFRPVSVGVWPREQILQRRSRLRKRVGQDDPMPTFRGVRFTDQKFSP